MSDTRASHWFSNVEEFRQLCGDAVSEAEREGDQDFAHDMMRKANQYGLDMFLSDKQLKNLCRIADWVVPEYRP